MNLYIAVKINNPLIIHSRMDPYLSSKTPRKTYRQFVSNSSNGGPYSPYCNALEKENQDHKIMKLRGLRDEEPIHYETEIDYRLKTFELMKKNAELQLLFTQSQKQIEFLSEQIDKLQSQFVQIVDINHGAISLNTSSLAPLPNTHNLPNCKKSNCQRSTEYDSSINTFHTHSLHHGLQQKPNSQNKSKEKQDQESSKLANQHQKISLQNFNTFEQSYESPSHIVGEYYESSMGEIIDQYKSIIQKQHQNNNRLKKKLKEKSAQVKQLSHSLKTAKQTLKVSQQECQEKQWKIDEYKEEVIRQQSTHTIESELLKQNIDELMKEKAEVLKTVEKLQEKIKTMTSSEKQLINKLKNYEQELVAFQREHNAEKSERKKLQHRYKEEIKHFEEMEDLVEKKLIEVSQEMNFYKKEKRESDEKIMQLQQILNYYRTKYPDDVVEPLPAFGVNNSGREIDVSGEIQKLYYSFGGESQKNSLTIEEPGSPRKQITSEEIRNSLQILKGQSSQSNSEPQLQLLSPQQEQTLIPSAQIIDNIDADQNEEAQKPSQSSQQVGAIQRQCYEQSIKTLLKENERLKKLLLAFYNKQNKKPEANSEEDNKQLEMEIKILISSMEL